MMSPEIRAVMHKVKTKRMVPFTPINLNIVVNVAIFVAGPMIRNIKADPKGTPDSINA